MRSGGLRPRCMDRPHETRARERKRHKSSVHQDRVWEGMLWPGAPSVTAGEGFPRPFYRGYGGDRADGPTCQLTFVLVVNDLIIGQTARQIAERSFLLLFVADCHLQHLYRFYSVFFSDFITEQETGNEIYG